MLPGEVEPGEKCTLLEDRSGVAEDEVDGAQNGAGVEELAKGLRPECVLVGVEGALVEGGLVGGDAQCDCLLGDGARGVAECYGLGQEALAFYAW